MEDLAAHSYGAFTDGAVQSWEAGKVTNITLTKLIALAKALGVHPAQLVIAAEGGDPDKWAEETGEAYKQAIHGLLQTLPSEAIDRALLMEAEKRGLKG